MKYTAVIASLLSNTQAISIREASQVEAGNIDESCMANYDRAMSQAHWTLADATKGNLHNGKYEDPSFPADMSSMYWERQTARNHGQVHTYKSYHAGYGITWKRPSELPGTPHPNLWGKHGVSVQVSEQGADGDCWFLSSTSALAGTGVERIKKVFTNTEYPADGAFQVKLHVRGEPISVIVDDRIPVLDLDDRYVHPYPPVNSRKSAYGDAWWLVILEKAMAKLNINYVGINGGTPGEALRALTGMPVTNFPSNTVNDDELWAYIEDGTNKKYPMAAGTRTSNHGLIAGHAYGVLGSQTLTSGGKVVHKLVKMRNPWGIEKYHGEWSDNSPLWTDAWRKEAGVQTKDDGIFFVPLDQWRQDWASLSVCHYRDDWHQTSFEGNPGAFEGPGQSSAWVGISNPVDQDFDLECTQTQKRLFPGGCEGDKIPQDFGFMIYDMKLNSLHTRPNFAMCDGDAMNIHLKKGDYQIRVMNFSGEDSSNHKQVWKLRTFGDKEDVPMHHQKNYVYRY